jgi:anti-sigma B factor antagonist
MVSDLVRNADSHKGDKMRIDESIQGSVGVLTIHGALMSGPEVSSFHDHVRRLILDGIPNVVVDFSNVKWFGSAMLGVMSAALASAKKEGGDIRLTGVTKKIESILMVTKLASVFRTIETVERAVASFETQPPETVEA